MDFSLHFSKWFSTPDPGRQCDCCWKCYNQKMSLICNALTATAKNSRWLFEGICHFSTGDIGHGSGVNNIWLIHATWMWSPSLRLLSRKVWYAEDGIYLSVTISCIFNTMNKTMCFPFLFRSGNECNMCPCEVRLRAVKIYHTELFPWIRQYVFSLNPIIHETVIKPLLALQELYSRISC